MSYDGDWHLMEGTVQNLYTQQWLPRVLLDADSPLYGHMRYHHPSRYSYFFYSMVSCSQKRWWSGGTSIAQPFAYCVIRTIWNQLFTYFSNVLSQKKSGKEYAITWDVKCLLGLNRYRISGTKHQTGTEGMSERRRDRRFSSQWGVGQSGDSATRKSLYREEQRPVS